MQFCDGGSERNEAEVEPKPIEMVVIENLPKAQNCGRSESTVCTIARQTRMQDVVGGEWSVSPKVGSWHGVVGD